MTCDVFCYTDCVTPQEFKRTELKREIYVECFNANYLVKMTRQESCDFRVNET